MSYLWVNRSGDVADTFSPTLGPSFRGWTQNSKGRNRKFSLITGCLVPQFPQTTLTHHRIVQTCFPFPAIKTSPTVNFLKGFSSDYKRGKMHTSLFNANTEKYHFPGPPWALVCWAEDGPAVDLLLPQPSPGAPQPRRPRRQCPP